MSFPKGLLARRLISHPFHIFFHRPSFARFTIRFSQSSTNITARTSLQRGRSLDFSPTFFFSNTAPISPLLKRFQAQRLVQLSLAKMVVPTIVIVPGFWLGPHPYQLLVDELKKKAPSLTDIVYAELASTGKRSPGAPTMQDDANGVRQLLEPLVKAGKRVVVVGHSAGAFLSSMATKDLEVGQSIAVQSGGGVERFIFIAGGILAVGQEHPPTNWAAKDGVTSIKDVDSALFRDVDPAVADKHCKAHLSSQPLMSEWAVKCNYVGWDKVPSSYILTEDDDTIPKHVQEMCAGLAKSEVIRIPTGHMPMLSQPALLAEKVISCLDLSE